MAKEFLIAQLNDENAIGTLGNLFNGVGSVLYFAVYYS